VTESKLVKLVAVLPLGHKVEEGESLQIVAPGDELEIDERRAEQLVKEGSAARAGTKEATAAKRAARRAAAADDEDDDED